MRRWWWAALAVVVLGCDDGGGTAAEADALPRDGEVDARHIDGQDRGIDIGIHTDIAFGPDGAVDGATDGSPVDLGPPLAQCADGVDNDNDGDIDLADRGCNNAADTNEGDEIPLPECDDAADNDADGLIDLADPDCSGPADPREQGSNAVTVCTNGMDDDGDGLIDFPLDPGCSAAGDTDEADGPRLPECFNQVDDDNDGRVDYPADPGCTGRGDSDEADPVRAPVCANGLDDDADGATDYPADTGCEAAVSGSEVGPCGEETELIDLTNLEEYRGDLLGTPAHFQGTCGGAAGGEIAFLYVVAEPLERLVFSTVNVETQIPTVLYLRQQCASPGDQACVRGTPQRPGAELAIEHPAPGRYYLFVDTGARDAAVGTFRLTVTPVPTPQCRDARDNDGDGRVDAADPGCSETEDIDETDPDPLPECGDGIDNDGDGRTDYPNDPECHFAGGDQELRLCAEGVPTVAVGQRGGRFELPVVMGAGSAVGSCEAGVGAEVVVILDLALPSDVTVRVTDANNRAVLGTRYIRTTCEDPASEVQCARGVDEALVAESLVPGRYYIYLEQGFAPAAAPRFVDVLVLSVIGECNDEVDNDGDGRFDRDDPGCETLRDPSEADPAALPACANGRDDDMDGDIDYPADSGCVAAGDTHEGGCQGNPQWEPVRCQINSWVWSSNNAFQTVDAAAANRVLWTGCRHSGDGNDDGYCSLDGRGWVSTQAVPMAGCDRMWFHLGGNFTGQCGGHDGDTVRRLVLTEDGCYDY